MPTRHEYGFVHICFINHPARSNITLNIACELGGISITFALYCCGTIDKTLIKPVKKLTFEISPSDPKAGIGLNFDVAALADPFYETIYYPAVCF